MMGGMSLGRPALRRARPLPLLAAALVVPAVAGCGLVDDLVGGGSRVEDTFEYLPADTTRVDFVDRAAIAERLGVDDVGDDATRQELEEYVKAFQDAPGATELAPWLSSMVRDAAFSDLDVEWEATAGFGDATSVVWKVSDDLDLDAVADDLLDAGYDESGSGEARVFEAGDVKDTGETGLFGDRYPVQMYRVAVVPDEHLVISGGGLEEVVDAVLDDADSLADDGGFDDLLELAPEPDDLETAALRDGDAACAAPVGGGRAPSTDGLGTPEGAALFTSGDAEPVLGALLFADEAAAEADAEARASYLEEFAEFYDLDLDLDVSTDGEAVLVETDAANAQPAVRALERAEGPLACTPEE